jgi:hypothetical protein
MATKSMAGDNPNYKSFASFSNDSLGYLKENFDDNEYYIGKTVGEFLNMMELKICRSSFFPAIWGDKKTRTAVFYFEESKKVSKTIVENGSKYLLKVCVSFEPIEKEEYEQYDTMVRNARNRGEVNLDTEWELFGKAFLENRIITKISVPDVVR